MKIQMSVARTIAIPAFAAAFACLASTAPAAQLMTHTLKDKPAIVVAAFGTSTKAQATYDAFDKQLKAALPGYDVRWAFTSEVIRERVNARRAKEGNSKRLLSLQQALADLEADGYTKVAVQPLQIFPGEEYEEVLRLATGFPGLRVEFGETLLQRWEGVHEVVKLLSRDFLPPPEGCNVIVAHGSPQTGVGSNSTYLGLDRYLSRRFPNAFLGCVEGVVTREDALEPAKACAGKRVRFIPLMFVGGDHIMNDIMGGEGGGDEESWKQEMTKAGKVVDIPTLEVGGQTQYRGLGFIPEVNEIFIREVDRALKRL